jgi:YXWGXW repeat-containing protein
MRIAIRVALGAGFIGAITVGTPVPVPAQDYPPPRDYDTPRDYDAPREYDVRRDYDAPRDYDSPQRDYAISVDVPPPPLPVYEQPIIPGPDYIWVPGYWAWSDDFGYYWVPGTWVLAPEPGLLWTPGYWAWNDGMYVFYLGYWGPHVGFYGGVNYGFGYTGEGYEGGYWRGGTFFYNTAVNNIRNVSITSVYTKNVFVNNKSNVSYNGGEGGITARPTPKQLFAAREHHLPPPPEQVRHVQAAARDPSLLLSNNRGHPAVAATSSPALFRGPGVVAARPGNPIQAKFPSSRAPLEHQGLPPFAQTPRSSGPSPYPNPEFRLQTAGPSSPLPRPPAPPPQSAFPSAPAPLDHQGPPPFAQTHASGLSPYPNPAFRLQTTGPTGPLPRPPGPPLDRRPSLSNARCPPGQQHC